VVMSGLSHFGPYDDTGTLVLGGSYWWSTAFVHSSHSADKHYQSSIWFDDAGYFGGNCVCLAEGNLRYCKHVAALVWSLYALNNHREEETAPKLFRRPGIKKFQNACAEVKTQVDYGKTWTDFVGAIETGPAKKRSYATSYSKFVTVSEVKTKKEKKQAKKAAKQAAKPVIERKRDRVDPEPGVAADSVPTKKQKLDSVPTKKQLDSVPTKKQLDSVPTKKQLDSVPTTAQMRKSTRSRVPKQVKDYADL